MWFETSVHLPLRLSEASLEKIPPHKFALVIHRMFLQLEKLFFFTHVKNKLYLCAQNIVRYAQNISTATKHSTFENVLEFTHSDMFKDFFSSHAHKRWYTTAGCGIICERKNDVHKLIVNDPFMLPYIYISVLLQFFSTLFMCLSA